MTEKKVLVVFAEPFLYGGQESFMINVYRHINHKHYRLDFLTPYICKRPDVISLLDKNGSKFYHGDFNFYTPLRKRFFVQYLLSFFQGHRTYDIVHINSGSSFALSRGASIVRRALPNAKIILHSHATGYNSIRHRITTLLLGGGFKKADMLIGCSQDALEHRFTKKSIKIVKSSIIRSGIDVDDYRYSKEIRQSTRSNLRIQGDSFVLGHIGRFTDEKNHLFILEVFKEITDSLNNAILLFIGDGPNLEAVKAKAKELGIYSQIRFIEAEPDIRKYLCAMDVFIFPSLFEGFGMAAIEAQAAGLPVFCSTALPKDVLISKNTFALDLSLGHRQWADSILKFYTNNRTRNNDNSFILPDSIDARKTTKMLEDIYDK